MTSPFWKLGWIALLLAAGCTKSEPVAASRSSEPPAAPQPELAVPEDAEGDEDEILDALLDALAVPTEDEAAEWAAASIDESNAEAEFARLLAEIEGDSDG